MRVTRSAARLGGVLLWLGCCITVCEVYGDDQTKAGAELAKTSPVALGYEIFNREWLPDDPRGHGGDGLGPVYNDSSCIACHNSGGSGGAGPASKNIDILSASRNLGSPAQATMTPIKGTENSPGIAQSSFFDSLDPIHPGFRTARNVVLHKFGIDPNYDAWRSRALRRSPGDASDAGPPSSDGDDGRGGKWLGQVRLGIGASPAPDAGHDRLGGRPVVK